jgi:hypothetical protein
MPLERDSLALLNALARALNKLLRIVRELRILLIISINFLQSISST